MGPRAAQEKTAKPATVRSGAERSERGWGPASIGEMMTVLALALSAAAFVYLVYAMLRPEKF